MGRLLDIAKSYQALPVTPATVVSTPRRETLAEFATSGRIVRLWSDVLGQEVVFAADNADAAKLPPGVPVYFARELAALWGEDGNIRPSYLRRIHEAKTMFDGDIIP